MEKEVDWCRGTVEIYRPSLETYSSFSPVLISVYNQNHLIAYRKAVLVNNSIIFGFATK